MSQRFPTSSRAFTLIEMIVVTIMVAIFATVTTLRMSNLTPRRAAVTVRQVSNVLDALAHRQIVSNSAVALEYDDSAQRLWIEHLVDNEDFDSGTSREIRQWTRDIMAPVVQFDNVIVLEGSWFDGARSAGSFRVEIPPGQHRPLIELDVAWPGGVDTVTLLPDEHRTIRTSGQNDLRPRPEDLDEQGADDESW
jgi:prepilin-type N-terminal cleavage/methylation domain-containing protein